MQKLIGTIEAGGTKFVLGIMNIDKDIIERLEIPTEHPDITLKKCYEYFKNKKISALGIGFFGPISVNKDREDYGYVLNTPKPNWSGVDVVGYFSKRLNVPIGFDTDVNAAALSEHAYGAGKEFSDIIYITVGTGIGAGLIINNNIVHGNLHPEMGHILLTRHEKDLEFKGTCPYHDNCAETLAAGPSIESRWGRNCRDIEEGNFAWELEAYYLAQIVSNMFIATSCKKVVMGGGVMHVEWLFSMINEMVKQNINNYVDVPENLVVPPALGDNAGVLGAYKLAVDAINKY